MENAQRDIPQRAAQWASKLLAANTQEEVLALVNRFLATFLPSDLERLPEECRYTRLGSPLELAQAAVDLARCELRLAPEEPGSVVALELLQVLIPAQLRIRQLLGRAADPGTR